MSHDTLIAPPLALNVVPQPSKAAPAYVRSFIELGRADSAVAGGKGANLGEMTHAGLPVPPGFVVTTDAYRAFVEKKPPGFEGN